MAISKVLFLKDNTAAAQSSYGIAAIGCLKKEIRQLPSEIEELRHADSPNLYLTTMAKKDRSGRIFLDYLRNDRTATAVAVLSTRARAGATVSMPLDWTQVKTGLDPRRFTIRTVPVLLAKSSGWKDYNHSARSLEKAIKWLTKSSRLNRPSRASALTAGRDAR